MEPQSGDSGDRIRDILRRSNDRLAPPSATCPSLDEWGRYSAGLLEDARAAELIGHAGQCAACGGLLADMSDQLEGEQLDEATRGAASVDRPWQAEMVTRIEASLGRPVSDPRRHWRPLRWAAVAAVLIGGFFAALSSTSVLWLLSQSGDRTFQYRMAGAPYQPQEAQRGASGGNDRPGTLLARLLISIRDLTGVEGPAWQHARARATMLQRSGASLESAIDTLSMAHAQDPDSASAANDLAVALLRRSDMAVEPGRTEDVARAIEVLQDGIRRDAVPELYFNLALAYEMQQAFNEALATWEAFLAREPSGGWADEARQRMQAIRQRQQARAAARPRRSEDGITVLAAAGFASANGWDPRTMAEDMASQHGDAWLADFLQASAHPSSTAAVARLAGAAKAISSGDASGGETQARQAEASFLRAGNTPGLLFSRYEIAYTHERQSQSGSCGALAQAALPDIDAKGYRWLAIQLRLTLATCLAQQKKFAPAYTVTAEAMRLSEQAGYTSLGSRSQSVASAILREVGSYRQALAIDSARIAGYWQGESTRNTVYSAYYGLAMSLAGLEYRQAAIASMGEAVRLASTLSNDSQEAMARARYGEMLMEGGRVEEAARELDTSEGIFARLAETPATALYRSYARVSRARLLGQRGQTAQGLELTGAMEQAIARLENPAIEAQLWQAKAELLTRAGRLQESEEPLRHLLAMGDAARSSAPAAGDRTALARRTALAVDELTDRYLSQGDVQKAWRVWTQHNLAPWAQQAVEQGTARVVLAALPSGAVAMVSSPAGLSAARLPDIASTVQLVRQCRRLMERPETPMALVRAMGAQVYQRVMAPIEPLVDGYRVLEIASSDPLWVPFGALVSPRGEWLADRFHIVYFPPLGGALPARESAVHTGLHLLAAGYGAAREVFGDALAALPDANAEIESAARLFPHSTVLAGEGATLAGLRAALEQSDVFQFSGHAVLQAGDAALVLAPSDGGDGLLWASQLAGGSLSRIRLAVLAACSTGRSADETHAPGASMARAFLQAGVPQVVASAWDVDSRATRALMTAFYEGLGARRAPAEALLQATSGMRKKPEFAHPYYWAAFALFRS